MPKAVFTSIDGGHAHRDLILEEIDTASALSWQTGLQARLDIMCFAFTDQTIADALVAFLDATPNASVRILADWSQGADSSPSVVRGLHDLMRDDLTVRIKRDIPYYKDPETGEAKWGYLQSTGMLHHKTMGIVLQGSTERVVIGSFNWSNRGARAYENTMRLKRTAEAAHTLDAFSREFDALWDDDIATMAFAESNLFAERTRALVEEGIDVHVPDTLDTIIGTTRVAREKQAAHMVNDHQIISAFSGRDMGAPKPHYGYSGQNNARKIDLLRPSGARKPAPVTINSIALEAIRSVPDGHPIDIAMYAMSPRVPEFTALLEAAQRGCKLRVILDGKLGRGMANRLARYAKDKNLEIEVCITNRRMHQKYLVAPMDNIVVTGTANMTEDATERHADHRLYFKNAPDIASSFERDFETIWQRIDHP